MLLFARFLLLMLVLLCQGRDIYAADVTVAGTVTTAPVTRGINIEAPYSGDDNANNSLLIEWDEDGGDWSSLLGTEFLANAVSPYRIKIGSLLNGSRYQVRITYLDPDNADNVQVLSDLLVYNPMLHNSITTGSYKWSLQGGWGIAGGMYGEFGCTTCHMRGSSNIKRIRTAISTPDDSRGSLPGDSQNIRFLNAVDGLADFGDDSFVRGSSDNICEACHSINKFHNYDRSNNISNGHQNLANCLVCHKHARGFTVTGCSNCHGGGTVGSAGANFWPDDSTGRDENDAGRHAEHIELLAQREYGLAVTALLDDVDTETKQLSLCGYCHASPGEDADHGDSTNLPADTVFHPLWDKSATDVGASYSAGNCTNLDCHNNQATGTGTFGWYDVGNGSCVMCHSTGGVNSATTANPSSGLHNLTANNATAHDGAFGAGDSFGCENCHVKADISGHQNGVAKSGDYTGSEVGLNVVNMYTDDGGSASSRGTCMGTTSMGSCHSDGGNWRRIWTTDADVDIVANPDPGQAACNVCHGQYASLTDSSGWNEGTSHYRSGIGALEDKAELHVGDSPDQCEGCHGYDTVATHNSNDAIDFSGDGSSDYVVTLGDHASEPGWYCATCHTSSKSEDASSTSSHTFYDSLAFPTAVIYAGGSNLPQGGCYICHGNGVDEYWPQLDSVDEADWPNRLGAHDMHVISIADAINGGGLYSGTTEQKNASCVYCHPGGGHTGDGAAAPADVFKDGQVGNSDADDNFIYVLDDAENPGAGNFAIDTDGTFKPYNASDPTNQTENYGTCSNIDCHANAPYSPHWYGDVVEPGLIANLTAVTHDTSETHVAGKTDEPGSVLLTWNAPGDDGDLDGTAYRYEVRYSTAPINAANFESATIAGSPPTVHRQGEEQRMVVHGLNPGAGYYFAVRSHDESYEADEAQNVSGIVATASPTTAHLDDVEPIFYGLDKTEAHDKEGVVNLSWSAAKDHSLPLTYKVWWSTYSLKTHVNRGGTMPATETSYTEDGGGGAPSEGGSDYTIYTASTTGLTYQVKDLAPGVLYNFVVHAVDGSPAQNTDDTCICGLALVNTPPQETETTKLYSMSGSSILVAQDNPASPDWGSVSTGTATLAGTSSATFTAGTDLDDDTSGSSLQRDFWVQGVSLDLYVKNNDRKYPQTFSVQLGYNNGSFNPLGAAVEVGIGRRAARVMKVSLSTFEGAVPENANLTIIIRRVDDTASGADITFEWGSDADKGQIMVNAQPINHPPTAPSSVSAIRNSGGYVDISWNPSGDGENNISQTLHYDVYGSVDNGTSYPYVIGLGLTDADAAGIIWDTVADGLSGNSYSARVKVEASDSYLFEENSANSGTSDPGSGIWGSHVAGPAAALTLDNRFDEEAPAPLIFSHEETRPKKGSIFLEWLAVGNDGYRHSTKASYYDIRYSLSTSPITDEASFATATQAWGEPVPNFNGYLESFELVGLVPDAEHSIGIKACDDGEDGIAHTADDNCSTLLGSGSILTTHSGMESCGVCHSTPPDEPATRGTHPAHGYTLEDCAKCHGDDVLDYTVRHYDGMVQLGWAENSDGSRAALATFVAGSGGSGVTVTQTTDNNGVVTIYQDPDGAGGYNAAVAYDSGAPLENTDSGSCMNFIDANANGCHGPFEPKWASDTDAVQVEPTCADCHGDKSPSRNTDPYGRIWDDVDGSNVPSDQVKAAPPQANHAGTETTDRYVGAHERHLNASFRFAKEDSCRLCHRETFETGLHANKSNDIVFDVAADESETVLAVYNANLADVNSKGISCSSLNNVYCHDSGARWAEPGAKCTSCHGMSEMGAVSHISDGGTEQECNYCHLEGHPQSPDGVNPGDPAALLINNNPAVGISYRSGGIHMRKVIGGRTTMNDGSVIDTLAEMCWGCHEDQSTPISEWGTNTEIMTGSSGYDYGSLDQTNWVGAIWSSGKSNFAYKTGYIQSVHTTDPSGTSAVTWDSANGRYNETTDPVDKIRCSNCHDVHDLNKAAGDTMTGEPYLRGTWMGNPYEEDGAPWNKAYASQNVFGAVPRGSIAYDELGGYYIDQNNVKPGTTISALYPTSGWTVQSSAGLCTLCHGTNIDEMDQRTGENLWIGTNGHSNSALGGTFSNAVNIFDYSHGRPNPVAYDWGGGRPKDTNHYSSQVSDISYMYQGETALAGGGYRGNDGNSGRYIPRLVGDQPYAFNFYDWGATSDADTTDVMYHQFSCSKCHNPHASRLPKLMITNCLDIRHNTWDENKSSLQNTFTASALDDVDRGKYAAYYASAQNCHRYDDSRSTDQLKGGWNKVTPWQNENINNTSHP